MKIVLVATAIVDLNAASDTTAATLKSPGSGYIHTDKIYGFLEEAIASGGFSTTAGVASVSVAGTEVATYSTGIAGAARAIGENVNFTTSVTNKAGTFPVSKGDAIVFKTKTAGVGGTLTGTVRIHVPLDIDPTV